MLAERTQRGHGQSNFAGAYPHFGPVTIDDARLHRSGDGLHGTTKSIDSGLYYAREARGMSRSELVRLSGISKQQLSRLENGQIRLLLDHLKPFAPHLGYTPEQMLLWGRYPGMPGSEIESSEPVREEAGRRTGPSGREARKRASEASKSERWSFPASFVREQLHTSPERILVLDTTGDSMAPTIVAGERVIVDTSHKAPTPDGLLRYPRYL